MGWLRIHNWWRVPGESLERESLVRLTRRKALNGSGGRASLGWASIGGNGIARETIGSSKLIHCSASPTGGGWQPKDWTQEIASLGLVPSFGCSFACLGAGMESRIRT